MQISIMSETLEGKIALLTYPSMMQYFGYFGIMRYLLAPDYKGSILENPLYLFLPMLVGRKEVFLNQN